MDSLEPEAGAQQRHGVPTYVVEAAVAAILLALALLVAQSSLKLGAGWTTDGPGSGYFPFYIGVILCIAVGRHAVPGAAGQEAQHGHLRRQRAAQARAGGAGAGAGVRGRHRSWSGMYVASAIYIAALHDRAGQVSATPRAWPSAVITAVLFFLMFEVWFKVPLFKGTFDPLAFLGY